MNSFFGGVLTEPNYDDWIAMPGWAMWQAVMLFSGMEPNENLFFECRNIVVNEFKQVEQPPQNDMVRKMELFEVAYRKFESAIYTGELTTGGQYMNPCHNASAAPSKFIRIARQYKVTFPNELELQLKRSQAEDDGRLCLNPKHEHYSHRLAMAVHAWEGVNKDRARLEKGKTPKAVIEEWLREHNKDNLLSENAIEEIAAIVNWKKGGAATTPNSGG